MVPNEGEQHHNWLPHPCLLGGQKEGGNATSPLHSRKSPTPSAMSKIRSGPQPRGTKSQVAASPLPSRGPKGGRTCNVTPAFSGVPNTKRGEQNQKWSPTKGNKIRIGCPTPAFSGGPKEGGNAMSPLHSCRPQRQARGAKSEVVPYKGEQNQNWPPNACLLGGPKEGGNAMSRLHS